MSVSGTGSFVISLRGNDLAVEVVPARPTPGFIFAVIVFVVLFGMPGLLVLVDPQRWDALSLPVAVLGLLAAAAAVFVPFVGRTRTNFVVGRGGVVTARARIPVEDIADVIVVMPKVNQVQGAGAFHAFGTGAGAVVGERERVRRGSVVLKIRGAARQEVVAAGLSQSVASDLRNAVLSALGFPPASDGVAMPPAQ